MADGIVTANGIFAAPDIQLRNDPVARPPLRVDGVAPTLRPYVPDAIPVPPEPSTPAPSFAQLAEQQRQALMNDAEFKKAYFAGDVNAKRTFEALHRILVSGAPDEQLGELAQAAGIEKPAPLPPAPPPRNLLEHADAKPGDYRVELRGGADPAVTAADAKDAGEFAAAMKFLPGLGNSVLARLVEIDGKVRAMPPHDVANWVDQQDQALISRAGSVEGAKALLADAHKALTELGRGSAWAAKSEQPAFRDFWTVLTLANHWRAHAATRTR
jgi:hypothetical protein